MPTREQQKRRNSLLMEAALYHEAATYHDLHTIGHAMPDSLMAANCRFWNAIKNGRLLVDSIEYLQRANPVIERLIAKHRDDIGEGVGLPPTCSEINRQMWSVLDRVSEVSPDRRCAS